MYRIALNTALTQYRKAKSKVPLSFIGFEFKDMIDKNDTIDQQENVDLLYSAISNLNEVFKSINLILSDEGVLIIEDPSLLECIKKNSYDQFYNEHIYVFLKQFFKVYFRFLYSKFRFHYACIIGNFCYWHIYWKKL